MKKQGRCLSSVLEPASTHLCGRTWNSLLAGSRMGIRVYCPNGHKLNVKAFLAGKKGICPHCGSKFEIPAGAPADQHEPAGHPELGNEIAAAAMPAAHAGAVAAAAPKNVAPKSAAPNHAAPMHAAPINSVPANAAPVSMPAATEPAAEGGFDPSFFDFVETEPAAAAPVH